jgi:hypothetical protein
MRAMASISRIRRDKCGPGATTHRTENVYYPVVASESDDTLVGLLDCPGVHRWLSAEVLARQKQADSTHSPPEA